MRVGPARPSVPRLLHPAATPDLNCADIGRHNFTVLPPDAHRFDADHDGIGCEA
jgi:micrococcal nuclease